MRLIYFTSTSPEHMGNAASTYFHGPLNEPYSDHPDVRLDISNTPRPTSRSTCRASCTVVYVTKITDTMARQAIAEALGVAATDIEITRDKKKWENTAPPRVDRSNENPDCERPARYLDGLSSHPDRYLPLNWGRR
jgi:hypothetical protein